MTEYKTLIAFNPPFDRSYLKKREDWFITDRKPTICPRCGKKEVRKAVLGYPTEEDFLNDNIYLIKQHHIHPYLQALS